MGLSLVAMDNLLTSVATAQLDKSEDVKSQLSIKFAFAAWE